LAKYGPSRAFSSRTGSCRTAFSGRRAAFSVNEAAFSRESLSTCPKNGAESSPGTVVERAGARDTAVSNTQWL
jgi:hypothetical protein